jgi:opacity protein-like surface antigen
MQRSLPCGRVGWLHGQPTRFADQTVATAAEVVTRFGSAPPPSRRPLAANTAPAQRHRVGAGEPGSQRPDSGHTRGGSRRRASIAAAPERFGRVDPIRPSSYVARLRRQSVPALSPAARPQPLQPEGNPSLRHVLPITALLVSGPALAQPDTGFYLEGNLGYSLPDSVDVSVDRVDGELELDDAFVFGGAAGYKFPWFRLEANVSYRRNDVDKVKAGGADTGGDGDVESLVGLVNAYLDLDLDLPVRPFVGGGIGAAYLKVDAGDNSPIDVDDDAGAFAWNLLAGVGYDVTESVALTATYRYLRLEGTDFSADLAGVDVGDLDVDDVGLHEVLLGLRYTF